MPWESEEEAVKPGRDWSRILWIVLVVLIIAGVTAMFMPKKHKHTVTEARVRHIMIRVDAPTEEAAQAALDEITSLRERIINGESFAKLATEYSEDPSSRSRGGDLGWVRRGELADAIDQYVWTAPIGEISPVLMSSYGLHIVLVTERYFSEAEQYEEELKERVLEHSTDDDGGEAPTP
jgi:parvulin-like peptidyl-prolyl isomerase